MRSMPPLNSLKAFEASGRHLNFRLAAEELNVTHGAVAQHVRSLEKILNMKLFHRHARGLSLTDDGRRYLPPIRRAFDMIAEATETLTPKDVVVTISTTPSFATRWLVPRLGQFSEDYPDIRMRLDASNTPANFQTDGVDIAIRQGQSPFGPGLVADNLFDSEIIAVCHPDLAKGENAIHSPEDLAHHVLLEDAHGHWPIFLQAALGDKQLQNTKTTNFSLTSLAIDAAIARQGVALTNRALVMDDLRENRLCQPFAFSQSTHAAFYVVAPREPRNPTLVTCVRDWLIKQAQEMNIQ
ncbi:transcriptional regulator GcvA [Cohaesibacter gelatinilyticus]|uniref:LysR family transcriptional regulator, glycine cleavage system transcriptional activator n=1 Tax=Cohaesibacter gelatinilyticus TaxID=372072 RepID=A0A285PD39_9HYPH|nr:transcriptional regulator GcvA [Cohaesibacter gelatinilyticus]SNZ19147.1 LysR family transcriptional regulator, glycine cleavage system transcriptional activator [Cohaesibacter gelatinilyticus]